MRFIAGTMAAVAVLAASVTAVAQQPGPAPATPAPVTQVAADPLNTAATYAFIMDGDTGLSLYSKRGDEAMIPASMSKLMLYYMVFERLKAGRLKMEDEFTVSEHAWRTGGAGTDGSTMFLPIHSKVTVQDLLKGAIIISGNDACITLAWLDDHRFHRACIHQTASQCQSSTRVEFASIFLVREINDHH